MRTADAVGAFAVIALTLMPTPAFACSVCGLAGPGDSGWAYVVMSVILSALPLGMIGGTVFWVYTRSAAQREVPADVPQHQNPVQLRSAGDR